MKFTDLELVPNIKESTVTIAEGKELTVKNYLPIADKIRFLEFVVTNALDETTGCFSPVRTEIYYAIAVCRWYAGMEFTEEDLANVTTVYDVLDTNNIINMILSKIDERDSEFMRSLVEDTVTDIARYNNSAAGIIQMMSANAGGLDTQISDILEKIKNGEGLEQLSVIKDVVGKD